MASRRPDGPEADLQIMGRGEIYRSRWSGTFPRFPDMALLDPRSQWRIEVPGAEGFGPDNSERFHYVKSQYSFRCLMTLFVPEWLADSNS